jgi:hypothetical protein
MCLGKVFLQLFKGKPRMTYLDHPIMAQLLSTAIERTFAEMRVSTPYMSNYVIPWVMGLSKTDNPADYFQHEMAFPVALFCWWFENNLAPEPDWDFQRLLFHPHDRQHHGRTSYD